MRLDSACRERNEVVRAIWIDQNNIVATARLFALSHSLQRRSAVARSACKLIAVVCIALIKDAHKVARIPDRLAVH